MQKLFAIERVWTIGFLALSVGSALFMGIQAFPSWTQMLILAVAGAAIGAMLSWVVLKVLWHIRVRINGGPFREGDLVQIIAGREAGKIARVYEQWPSRSQVRVELGEAARKDVKDVFSYVQLYRVEAKCA